MIIKAGRKGGLFVAPAQRERIESYVLNKIVRFQVRLGRLSLIALPILTIRQMLSYYKAPQMRLEIQIWAETQARLFSLIQGHSTLRSLVFLSDQINLQSGENLVVIRGLIGSILLQIKNAVSVFILVQCYSH